MVTLVPFISSLLPLGSSPNTLPAQNSCCFHFNILCSIISNIDSNKIIFGHKSVRYLQIWRDKHHKKSGLEQHHKLVQENTPSNDVIYESLWSPPGRNDLTVKSPPPLPHHYRAPGTRGQLSKILAFPHMFGYSHLWTTVVKRQHVVLTKYSWVKPLTYISGNVHMNVEKTTRLIKWSNDIMVE